VSKTETQPRKTKNIQPKHNAGSTKQPPACMPRNNRDELSSVHVVVHLVTRATPSEWRWTWHKNKLTNVDKNINSLAHVTISERLLRRCWLFSQLVASINVLRSRKAPSTV